MEAPWVRNYACMLHQEHHIPDKSGCLMCSPSGEAAAATAARALHEPPVWPAGVCYDNEDYARSAGTSKLRRAVNIPRAYM